MVRSKYRPPSSTRDSRGKRAFVVGCCAAFVLFVFPLKAASAEDRSETVTFDQYTPLSTNIEMARRLLSPLTAIQIPERLAASGKALADQPIDLTGERFRIYVPRVAPAAGYGVLVFIPPWDDDHMPPGWAEVLESKGVIFVSGGKTGNDASPLGRRDPLALLAAYNVMRRYKVDPQRVYVAGFSGGSRVALRLVVGYPDLFTGAFLDAGADPLGQSDLPAPPRDLFDRFRTATKIEYFTGALDEFHLRQQDASVMSLKRWCVVNFTARSKMGLAHEIAPPSALAMALNDLDEARNTPSAKEADCWTRLTGAVDDELSRADAALARPDYKISKSILADIDKRFSGLASPRVIELARKLRDLPPSPSGEGQTAKPSGWGSVDETPHRR